MLISRLPLQSAPIDSCTLIYKSVIEKGAADIFTSVYKKDMTVCWWYYPFSHSCISRLSGRQCDGCQCWLLKAVFLFTHQNIENISSNELSLPPKNKDPGCHSEQCVLHSCLPTVWWADVWMIMPSRGLVSLQTAVSLPLSHTHHFHSLSEVKTKAPHETDDSDLFCCDMKPDSVTLTEPGLTVLAVFFFWKYTFANTLWSVCMLTFALKEHFLIVQNARKFIPVLMQCRSTDSFCSLYVALIFEEIIFSLLFFDFSS